MVFCKTWTGNEHTSHFVDRKNTKFILVSHVLQLLTMNLLRPFGFKSALCP